jgi:hypothetical protein
VIYERRRSLAAPWPDLQNGWYMKNYKLIDLKHARIGALLLALAATVSCGDSAEPAPLLNSPIVTLDGGTGGTLGGTDAGVGSVVDSALPAPSGGDSGAVQGGTGGTGGTAAGGSLDTPWCKAKVVLERHCTRCHDGEATAGTPDKIAFNNLSHLLADSKTPGAKYYQRAGVRIHDVQRPMPPTNDMGAADKAILDAWVASGGAAGANPTCSSSVGAPGSDAGVAAGDGGTGATVDAAWPVDCEKRYKILSHGPGGMNDPYMVQPGEEIHPQVIFDAPWGNEEVQALSMRPVTDNKRVLHHWILYEQGGGAFLTGWAPGAEETGQQLPADVGMYLAKGPQSLRLDMHYYNKGGTKVEADQSGVEICVVSKPKFRKHTATVFPRFGSYGLDDLFKLGVLAPANSTNYASTGVCNVTATQPVTLLTASPHAHTLAIGMKFTARAGGKDVLMHEGPFVFEEQRSYTLKEPVVLNTGDTVTTTCYFTNKSNQDVTFGENTGNEMCFNFAVYYPMGALTCGL